MMQALILAGGKGTRLRPYTTVLPKPLMPIGDYPILEIILRQLKVAGISEIILAVGYMSHLFQALFQDGDRYGLKISYSFENEPLGTAGPIALALDRLGDDFVVMNGDLLTTMNYAALIEFHKSRRAAATIGIFRREVKIDFGVIETDSEGRLTRYIEKPLHTFDVSMGINVLSKAAVRPHLLDGNYLDIPDLMMRLVADGNPVHCYREPSYWLDIGRVDDYQTAVEVFLEKQSQFLAP